jgi:sulfur carrier protein
MQITVNGKTIEIKEDTSLLDLLESKKLKPNTVVVEFNKEILNKNSFANVQLKNNDVLEIIHFVGGG